MSGRREPIHPRPVIVVHLDTAEGARLTACTGEPFVPDHGVSYLDVPRVPCTGCLIAERRAHESR